MIPARHKQEHRALNVFGAGYQVTTVGRGGRYGNLQSAMDFVNTLPDMINLVTATCTSVESNVGGTLDKRLITADAGTPFDVYIVGQIVGVKVGTNTAPVLAVIIDSTTLLFRNTILADLAATSCIVGVPTYKTIAVLDGHTEDVGNTVINVPSFTTIGALRRGTTRIQVKAGLSLFDIPSSSNETRFCNLGLASSNLDAIRIFSYVAHPYQGDTYLDGIDSVSTGQDSLYFADGTLGGVHMRNCNMMGGYDVMRLRVHREVNLFNNVLDAHSIIGSSYAQASAIALGAGTLMQAPLEKYNFRGNTIRAFGQDVITGVVAHGSVRTIDLRNRLNSTAILEIIDNDIYATGDTANPVTGFAATAVSAGAETPTIIVKGNEFDVRNNGAGTQLSMNSTVANYDIKRANNTQLSGCVLGLNTTALTTV